MLLSIARLHWKKGYEHTLAAVARVRAAGMELEYRIVGDGPYEDAVCACVEDLGLGDCVVLLGAQSRDAVLRELQQADLLLHGAVSEGFCNAVLEAQACGLPVVCTDADGLSENVETGESGLVVPRRDPVAFADAVAQLGADPETRRRMGEAGRRRAIDRFRLERQAEEFVDLYQLATAARARRPGRVSARSARGSAAPTG
jgi:colanic acid/amylovoran biosynthesis glycosyltransferase